MIKRIESINNPNFFFMNYNKQDLHVKDFLMVPKYFFSPEIIEKRKPLSDTARKRILSYLLWMMKYLILQMIHI